MNRLIELRKYGQSYWLDNLTRDKIKEGEIERRVKKEGLRGITSNPSIFNKAFTESKSYKKQILDLAKQGKSLSEIYDDLTIQDIKDACELLKPVYEESNGEDGYVSLEVSPLFARDTKGTIREAKRLFEAVDKKNCYIKIPGTKEGVPAIEESLVAGIPINVTLLFSLENYEAVANAYIRALKRRVDLNRPLEQSHSVASFFLSRIDVLIDEILTHYLLPSNSEEQNKKISDLKGLAGIASAKLAYKKFQKIFSGREWEKLIKKGARVQRLLWASTSTKNPAYSDVMYVNSLIGEHTVNTLTESTIAAFADHGTLVKNAIEQDLNQAKTVFKSLEKIGIQMPIITSQLENEGIQKFRLAFNEIMKTLQTTLQAAGNSPKK